MPGRVHEAPWRELHSLMVRRATASDVGGPLAFENLDSNFAFDIWTGGLAGDQAKVVDTIEAVYHVPAAMFQTTGQRCYEQGVKLAKDVAWRLGQAISTYHREIGDSLDRPEARDRRDKLRDKTAFQFWTQVERNVPLLLGRVDSNDRPADTDSWSQSEWGLAIQEAARNSYELACPRYTGRQMQAFVKGLSALFRYHET